MEKTIREKRIRERELQKAIGFMEIKHLSLTETMLKTLILRNKGLTFEEIGKINGCSGKAARQSYTAAKAKVKWLNKIIEEA